MTSGTSAEHIKLRPSCISAMPGEDEDMKTLPPEAAGAVSHVDGAQLALRLQERAAALWQLPGHEFRDSRSGA